MIQKLVILGILKERPSSGYDIKKYLNEKLGIFSKIETKSIYYPLSKMEKEGLITKRTLQGETNLKKYIYQISLTGEKEFIKLCRKSLMSQKRPFIESDLPLYFMNFLKKKEILPLLRLRLLFLEKVKEWLKQQQAEIKKPLSSLLLEHHYRLATVEKEFIKGLIKEFKTDKAV